RYRPCKAKHARDAARATRTAEVDATVASAASGNTPLTEKPTRQAWSDAPLLPIATLRKLDLDVALNFGRLAVGKLPIDAASLK
ncbi:AsmA family protein, partial [Pseudomonas aeruginosa]